MKLFISSDIEGTCDLCHWDETEPGKTDGLYSWFKEQMTREVAAACRGAIASGYDDILVKDAHDSGRNIYHSGLPRQARLNRAWAGDLYSMASGLQKEKFDAMAFTGYHDAAFSAGNPLSHTHNLSIDRITINGKLASEFMIWAYGAGYLGIPVVFLSGDAEICRKAKELIPGITTFATKEGDGNSVTSMHPDAAVEGIEQAMKAALAGDISACAVPMPKSFEVEIRYTTHQKAYSKEFYPGARRVDAKTIAFETADYMEVQRFLHFVL